MDVTNKNEISSLITKILRENRYTNIDNEKAISDFKKKVKIESGEKILYTIGKRSLKGLFKFQIDVIITDLAIYVSNDTCKSLRMSFENICRFACYISYGTRIIAVRKDGVSYWLIDRGVLKSKDQQVNDLINIINIIQRELYENSDKCKTDREELFLWASGNGDKDNISYLGNEVLKELIKERDFVSRCLPFFLKEGISKLDDKLILKSIGVVDVAEQEVLCAKVSECIDETIEEFINDYIYGQKNTLFVIDKKEYAPLQFPVNSFLNKYYPENIRYKMECLALLYRQFDSLVDDKDIGKQTKSDLISILDKTNIPEDQRKKILIAWGNVHEFVMHKFTNAIMDNESRYIKNYKDINDGYGFTSLHFLILLKNNDLFKSKVKSLDDIWYSHNSNVELDEIYNYSFVAASVDNWEIVDYLYSLTDEYRAISKSISTIRKKIKALKGSQLAGEAVDTLLSMSESGAAKSYEDIDSAQRRVNSYEDKIRNGESMDYAGWSKAQDSVEEAKSNFNEKMASLQNSRDTLADIQMTIQDRINELEEWLQELDDELKIYCKENREIWKNRVYFYKVPKDAFVIMIIDLYKSFLCNKRPLYNYKFGYVPAGLFLSEVKEKIVLKVHNNVFIVDKQLYDEACKKADSMSEGQEKTENFSREEDEYKKAEQDNAKRAEHNENKTDNKQRTEQSKIKQPYGDSWFSREAHENVKLLKKEYRILVKQYHPDMCGGNAKIFIEIQNEMEKIIDNIK